MKYVITLTVSDALFPGAAQGQELCRALRVLASAVQHCGRPILERLAMPVRDVNGHQIGIAKSFKGEDS